MTQDGYEVGSLENAEKFAIIRMAREAGFVMNEDEAKLCHPTPKAASLKNMIERFAALVAAHERETCAKSVYDSTDWAHEERDMVLKEAIAAAIRARK